MKIEINNENFQKFTRKDTLLIIDNEFLKSNNLIEDSTIEITGLSGSSISCWINKLDQDKLKIEIKDSSLKGLFVESSKLSELKILSTTISELKNAKFKTYKTYIDNSIIQNFWTFSSTFYNGLLIRKKSEIDKIFIHECLVDFAFTFINSTAKEITVESSKLTEFSIDRIDYPEKGSKTQVDKINVFRTEISKYLKVWETSFDNIHFHKIKLYKSDQIDEVFNNAHISSAKEKEKVNCIKITESEIAQELIISVNELLTFNSIDNNFNSIKISFSKITDSNFSNCKVSGGCYWGFPHYIKTIENFQLQNCQFEADFFLSDISFTKKLNITGSIFQKHPSNFSNNYIEKSCHCDFKNSNLTNFVFQNIDFSNFEFMNLDISNSLFIDCNWIIKKERLLKRMIVADEVSAVKEMSSLIELKNIYSKLKNNFLKRSDHIKGGMFNVSEQEVKRIISLKDKSYFEYILLTAHKYISTYGENLSKPLIVILSLMLLLSFVYIFTGFYSGYRLVDYTLSLDISNFKNTFIDWSNSIVFSLKNIVPFSVTNNFFLHSNESIPTTQVIEFFQKMINLFFATSFTAAFVKYLKK